MENNAYFGNGKDFKIGYEGALGTNFKSLNRIVTKGNYLMIAEDVLLLGGGHKYDKLDIPMGINQVNPKHLYLSKTMCG